MLTDDCEDLLKIENDEEETVENMCFRFNKMRTKITFSCFGKNRVNNHGNKNEQTNDNINTSTNDNKRIDDILKEKSTRLAKEIE